MHPSTIAAILAFTAGMGVNGAPVNQKVKRDAQGNLPDRLRGAAGQNVGRLPGVADGLLNNIGIDVINTKKEKRNPQISRGGGRCLKDGAGGCLPVDTGSDLPAFFPEDNFPGNALGSVSKRDPQRSRLGRLGQAAEGFAGGVGLAADGLTIGSIIQGQQKREAQRSRLGRLGQAAEGFAGGVGLAADGLTIGSIIGGQQKRSLTVVDENGIPVRAPNPSSDSVLSAKEKREAQRSRLGRLGQAAEGFAGGVGLAADGLTIGSIIGGQQKRSLTVVDDNGIPISVLEPPSAGPILPAKEPLPKGVVEGFKEKREAQRSRGSRLGQAAEGFADGVGLFGDALTIGDLIQNGKVKRDLPINDAIDAIDNVLNKVDDFSNSPAGIQLQGGQVKREAQRSRLGRLGQAADGFSDGVGLFNDALTIGDILQNGKRATPINDAVDAIDNVLNKVDDFSNSPIGVQLQNGKRELPLNNALDAIDDVLDQVDDFSNSPAGIQLQNGKRATPINDAVDAIDNVLNKVDDFSNSPAGALLQGQIQKRDPQRRGRLGRLGQAAEGFADGVGALTDGLLINEALQGGAQPVAKRDPQRRGRLGRLGQAAEGFADGVGALTDGLLLNEALQGGEQQA